MLRKRSDISRSLKCVKKYMKVIREEGLNIGDVLTHVFEMLSEEAPPMTEAAADEEGPFAGAPLASLASVDAAPSPSDDARQAFLGQLLCWAMEMDNVGLSKLLVEEGRAPVDHVVVDKEGVDSDGLLGFTPLHFAASNGNVALVEWLIGRGSPCVSMLIAP
jgi:hypothetical protein